MLDHLGFFLLTSGKGILGCQCADYTHSTFGYYDDSGSWDCDESCVVVNYQVKLRDAFRPLFRIRQFLVLL